MKNREAVSLTPMSNENPKNYEQVAEEAGFHLDAGEIECGITLLKQASALAESTGDLNAHIELLNKLGLAEKRAGKMSDARETFIGVISLLKQVNASSELAKALNNLGFVERDLGNLDAARQQHEEALAIFKTLNDPVGMAWTLTELGITHKDRGRLTEARANFEHALALLAEQDAPRERGHALVGLGLTLEMLNNFEGAQARYEEARLAYRQAGDRENEALTLHNLGKLHDNKGDLEAALDCYRQSLEVNQSIGAQLGVAEDLGAMASIYQEAGDVEQAQQMHEQALCLYSEIGYCLGQTWTLIDLGILLRDAGRFDEAKRYLTDALVLAQQMVNPHEIYEVYLNRGDVCLMANRLQEAAKDYAAAVDAVESVRGNLLLEEEALAYFNESRLEAYDRLVRLYVCCLNDSKQALAWAERTKSREFVRRLRLSEIVRSRRVPEELRDRETQLMTQLRQAAAELQAADEPQRPTVLRNYEEVDKNLRQVWDEIEPLTPEYVALRQGKPSSWEELQECLQA